MNPNEFDQIEQLRKQQEMRNQIRIISAKLMTREARSRLGNIRTVKPELAAQIELQLVQLVQNGQMQDRITDADLKTILRQLQNKKEITIKRK